MNIGKNVRIRDMAFDMKQTSEFVARMIERACVEFGDVYSESFKRYYRRYATSVNATYLIRYISNVLSDCSISVKNKRVLDAGSGFGLNSVILRILGAEIVYSLDFLDDCVRSAKRLTEMMKIRNIYPIMGLAEELGKYFEPESFDIIFCVEAVSHFRDTAAFFSEAAKALRKNGHLLIVDSNNGMNPGIVARTRKEWQRIEKVFCMRREQLISVAFPDIERSRASELAKSTVGLHGKEILDYVRDQDRKKNESVDLICPPVDPVNGEPQEVLLDPLKLKQAMEQNGLETKVFPYFMWGKRQSWIERINIYLGNILGERLGLRVARGFRILGIKK
jgi:2-polyprenyl-3-methyl-5-hydroxy-6-metoxy-1,4-benzoquinol methylase